MLTDTEDERVVEDEVRALWLGNIEVVTLCVRCGVKRQKGIRRVAAGVRDWKAHG